MRTTWLALCLIALAMTGCASVDVKSNLVTLDKGYFRPALSGSAKDESTKAAGDVSRVPLRLQQAHGQVTGTMPLVENASQEKALLPSYVLNQPLLNKLIVASYETLAEGTQSKVEISKDDIAGMAGMLRQDFLSSPESAAAMFSDSKVAADDIIRSYLMAYYGDSAGFINREGMVLKRPEIKNSIGNDVITAVVSIVIEGLFDAFLKEPVDAPLKAPLLIEDGAAGAGPKPTGLTLGYLAEVKVGKNRLKAIRYLSGVAGDQSKALSGAAFRAFGGLDIGFIVGGKFSFGDNETLAKILDTVFEVASRRLVEYQAYRGSSSESAQLDSPDDNAWAAKDSKAKVLERVLNKSAH